MIKPADRFKLLCDKSGMTEDKPLHAVLDPLHQSAVIAQDAAREAKAAKVLSAEGNVQLACRTWRSSGRRDYPEFGAFLSEEPRRCKAANAGSPGIPWPFRIW